MKLELKHLAPYLPYDLEFICICPESMEYEISCISNMHLGNELIEVGATDYEFSDLGGEELKPILRPLSDLTKEIEHNGEKFMPINLLNKTHPLFAIAEGQEVELDDIGICYTETTISDYLYLVNQLFEWHFDIYGLIPAGLAVDINKLER